MTAVPVEGRGKPRPSTSTWLIAPFTPTKRVL